jgi:hypothetical protein
MHDAAFSLTNQTRLDEVTPTFLMAREGCKAGAEVAELSAA